MFFTGGRLPLFSYQLPLLNALQKYSTSYFFYFFYSCTGLFVGPYCQWKNPCHTGPVPRCQNGGTCAVTQLSPHSQPGFSCQCPLGFTASLCEIPISNACDSKPCQNGGTCWLHNIREHRCNCAPGFTGIYQRYCGLGYLYRLGKVGVMYIL